MQALHSSDLGSGNDFGPVRSLQSNSIYDIHFLSTLFCWFGPTAATEVRTPIRVIFTPSLVGKVLAGCCSEVYAAAGHTVSLLFESLLNKKQDRLWANLTDEEERTTFFSGWIPQIKLSRILWKHRGSRSRQSEAIVGSDRWKQKETIGFYCRLQVYRTWQ